MQHKEGDTRNQNCVTKNAPVSSQAGAFRREDAVPRRLQEVVARIATRDRPEGECKNRKKRSSSSNNRHLDISNGDVMMKTSLKGSRTDLTTSLSTPSPTTSTSNRSSRETLSTS